ncbi:hypothetical protein [Arsenicitalea aurantiaca]|uniref:hypothetical protein n=1 Tax=Arsenicitalea aurantiaca TaxID=1783274 RepID=UPI00131591F1|nr:hypothetical protein [Arsenicitalea aurantiaca]
MIIELIHALPTSERRVLNRKEAASYVGVSVAYFSQLVRDKQLPASLPLGSVQRWDRAALDAAIDQLSGLDVKEETPRSAYDIWRQKRGEN